MKKITKNTLRNLIKETLLEYIGTEKMPLAASVPSVILATLKDKSISDKDKAQEIYTELYQNRRRGVNSKDSKSVRFNPARVSELDAVAKSTNPNLLVNLGKVSSWTVYRLYEISEKAEIQAMLDAKKNMNFSAYFSIEYKPAIKTATPEQIEEDWLSFLKDIVRRLSNRIGYQELFRFKHGSDIGKFLEDQDNLKFYFSVPKGAKLGTSYQTTINRDVSELLDKTKYFSIRSRGGAGWAAETDGTSYGQYVSAYTAEKLVDKLKSKPNPTLEDVKREYNLIISQIDPTEVYEKFMNTYGIDLEETG